MPQLRYIDDEGQLQTKTLDNEPCVIGRSPDCRVIVVDDTISREHVRIELEAGGRYRIRDLGSRNKTHVNGEVISETVLQPGDIIRAGSRVFEFLDEARTTGRLPEGYLSEQRSEPPHCEWLKAKALLSLTVGQMERLAALMGDHRVTVRPEDFAEAILPRMLLELHAERGLIALRGENKLEIKPITHRSLSTPPQEANREITKISQPFILAPILQQVGGRYPTTANQLNTKLGYAITAIVAPLTYRGEVIGVLYIDRATAKKPFTTADLQYAMAAGAMIGASIAELTRNLSRLAAREGASWINVLRRVQNALMGTIESNETFTIVSKIHPGRARCGDFPDVIHVDEQRCCVLVIDGGGHGMTGLTQAAAIRSAIRTAINLADNVVTDPADLFNTLNTMLVQSSSKQIIPCVYLGFDIASGRLAYINAGCPPPLLMVAPGRLITLDRPSLVLGVDADYIYETGLVDLPERFRFVCHTDGLTEGANASGEALGHQRIHETLLEHDAFESPQAVLTRIENAWNTHVAGGQSDDDAAILVLGRD